MARPKLMIPLSLERDNPLLYKLASTTARTQQQADRYIRIAYPDWNWADDAKRPKGVKGDIQAAGSYSLEHCQGGARYHAAGKPRERQFVVDTRVRGAVVEVERVFRTMTDRKYPKGTKRLSGPQGGMWIP